MQRAFAIVLVGVFTLLVPAGCKRTDGTGKFPCGDMMCASDEACVHDPCCEPVTDGGGGNLRMCINRPAPPPTCKPRPNCRGKECSCFNPCNGTCESVADFDVFCGCGF